MTPDKKRRSKSEIAADLRARSDRLMREAFVKENHGVSQALATASKCILIADGLPRTEALKGLYAALHDCSQSLDDACESIITAALSRPAPGKAEEKQL